MVLGYPGPDRFDIEIQSHPILLRKIFRRNLRSQSTLEFEIFRITLSEITERLVTLNPLYVYTVRMYAVCICYTTISNRHTPYKQNLNQQKREFHSRNDLPSLSPRYLVRDIYISNKQIQRDVGKPTFELGFPTIPVFHPYLQKRPKRTKL